MQQAGLISTGLLCGGFGLLANSCSGYRIVQFQRRGDSLIIDKAVFNENNFVLVRPPELPAPIYLRKTGDDSFSAVLLLCTHKQCEVSPGPNLLECPCHGSAYKPTGEVVRSPAEKNLHQFTVHSDEEYVYVELRA